MIRRTRIFRGVGVALIALGVIAAVLNLVLQAGSGLALALVGDFAIVAVGAVMLTQHRRSLVPATEAPGRPATSVSYRLVLVLCDERAKSPLYEQARAILLNQVAAGTPRSLAPDVEFIDVWVPSLPAENRAALEPVVWALQGKFQCRGEAWQADFHDPMGQEFVLVYLA